MSLTNITFILHKPQLSENIGACARALKNFNFNNLSIVNPKPSFPNDKIIATSVGAKDVIKKAKVYENLETSLSNLDIFAGKTFDTFQTDLVDYSESEAQSLATAFNGALNYAQNPDGWLLLEGSYGCGKTHLAAAVGHQRLLQGDTVLFITTPDLLDHLRSTFSPRSETTYDELFDRVRETDLLILDDLGVENPSEWAKEKLFQLINHRYSRRMSTIVTTNSDIDGLDPRLRSRLLDIEITHIIKIVAPDYRSRRQNERKQVLSRLHMYVNMTTDNFDPHSNLTYDEQQNLRRAMEAALKFGSHPHGWLMFVGGYGTGKTHLAAIIANYRHEKGDEVLFITVADLMDYPLP